MRLAILLLLALVGAAIADTAPPAIVTDGLNAYYRNGAKAALNVWLAGSPLENNFSPEGFAQIEKAYGRMLGYEIIRVVPVSPSIQRVYVLIKYEWGPAYVAFDCYKPDTRWIIPMLSYNTKPTAVLPERLLIGTGK